MSTAGTYEGASEANDTAPMCEELLRDLTHQCHAMQKLLRHLRAANDDAAYLSRQLLRLQRRQTRLRRLQRRKNNNSDEGSRSDCNADGDALSAGETVVHHDSRLHTSNIYCGPVADESSLDDSFVVSDGHVEYRSADTDTDSHDSASTLSDFVFTHGRGHTHRSKKCAANRTVLEDTEEE